MTVLAGVLPGEAATQCSVRSIGTHALNLCVRGTGSPTVVLAAGAGLASPTWDRVVPALAGETRVVTFDRAGLGLSEPGPPPRTPTRIAREVAELLAASGIEGPLVLVGHSAGGWQMLRLAELLPERVAGVLLLDTPPQGFEQRRLDLLSEEERAERLRVLERGLEGAAEVVRLEREGASAEAGAWFGALPERVPLVVVAADGQDFGTLGSQQEHRSLWVEMSRAYVSLSEAGRFVLASGSGHMVHHEREDLVVRLIFELVAGAR